MLVRKTIVALVMLALEFAASHATAAELSRRVDVRASHATFTIGHLLIEKVSGNVPIVAGSVELGPDGATPTAIAATLDPRHINSGDGDRDGDLQGPDWFDTKRFPTWDFRSTRVRAEGNDLLIDGTLTIHGASVPVVLVTHVDRANGYLHYRATTSVDRHAFGMTVTRIDGLVGRDVAIALDISLVNP